MQQQSKGVSYIVNSKKPYPEWIRNHTVFKEMDKIDKVFPRIGLPNFKEEADIVNTAEALNAATHLGASMARQLGATKTALYNRLDTALKTNGKERNEMCSKIQSAINLIGAVQYSMQFNDYTKVVDGKVIMRLRGDVFGNDNAPVFRKDEAIFRVINKLRDISLEIDPKILFVEVDQMSEFKEFSRINVPNKKYNIVFSSSGENGAWDISTMSMRGIISCQAWGNLQSKGLVGSISSKFVGVIYISSDQEIPGYGQKMLNRCVARFCIHRNTRKPVIMLDNMYPSFNQGALDTFRKIIKEKSGLDTLYVRDPNGSPRLADYYIPDETSRRLLQAGEASYMDSQIAIEAHKASIKKPISTNLLSLTSEFRNKVCNEFDNMIKARREVYEEAYKKHEALLAEYDIIKAKWIEDNGNKPEDKKAALTMERPIIAAEHEMFTGGVIGLIKHCDKRTGINTSGKTFANIIFDAFEVPGAERCTTKEEYHRKYLMAFLRNPAKVKAAAWVSISKGSWMKCFPKSAEKFFEFIFSQMKEYVVASCKELIKKAN